MNKVKSSKYILNKNSSIQDALNKFRINRCRAALILEKNKVIGSISEGDIIRALITGISLHAPIIKYMNKNFKFLKDEKKFEINKLIIRSGKKGPATNKGIIKAQSILIPSR